MNNDRFYQFSMLAVAVSTVSALYGYWNFASWVLLVVLVFQNSAHSDIEG